MLLATRTVRLLTRIAISAVVFIVFALHIAASPRLEIIDRMENYLYDVRVRATMPGGIDERIVIVDIDEASQLQFGQWPWARATLAGIVDTLFDDYGIKTLGFDVLFAEAERGDGVGCESCHGGAENWLATHYNTPTVTHAANLSAGMFATENAAERARLCLSCHLGTNNKFATHGIMAAGHPRLAFELDTFTELWRTAGRQPHYRVDSDYRERKGSTSHTYTLGGIIARRGPATTGADWRASVRSRGHVSRTRFLRLPRLSSIDEDSALAAIAAPRRRRAGYAVRA